MVSKHQNRWGVDVAEWGDQLGEWLGTDTICHVDKNIVPFLEEAWISQVSGNIRPKGGQKPPRLKPISGGKMLVWG